MKEAEVEEALAEFEQGLLQQISACADDQCHIGKPRAELNKPGTELNNVTAESDKGGSESDDHGTVTSPIETTITHDEFLQHMSACREYICAKHSRRAVFKLMAVDRMCREERSEDIALALVQDTHRAMAKSSRASRRHVICTPRERSQLEISKNQAMTLEATILN